MRSIRVWQGLAIAVMIHAMLLVAGVVGLELVIQHRIVEPPTLYIRYSGIGIAAYRTHYPDCPTYTQCPPQSVALPQEYYVVWIIHIQVTADQHFRRTATRLVGVPLQHYLVQNTST